MSSNDNNGRGGKSLLDLFKLERWQVLALILVVCDAISATFSYLLALWLRFDCAFSEIPVAYLDAWKKYALIHIVITVAVLLCFHLYRSLWRFASYIELRQAALSSLIIGALHALFITLFFCRMPISYYVFGAAIQFLLIVFVRFFYRFASSVRNNNRKMHALLDRVMIIGAGSAGRMIIRDIQNSKELEERVVCIIDDDRNKWGRYIDGVQIVGGREEILLSVEKYKIDKIYLTMPGATNEQRRDILNICKETGCKLRSLPGINELVSGSVTASHMKDVAVEDLLGREPIVVNSEEIFSFISGKVILVTGGGGSIGSELCRQIAAHDPKQLVILDVYENNAHAIGLELRDKYPELNLEVLIGSVRDSRRVNQVFAKYKPDVVYHAAAHKHVPLMEDSPCESIKNNAVGTYKTAYAAMMNGCKRFVLISTDKAVNPTNIMGASKRLCEMVIQTFDRKIREGRASDLVPLYLHADDDEVEAIPAPTDGFTPVTEYVAVRFGNVLGSNGSVIPRFKEQIERGGPVTVTHPDIIRYFMTIPEAASLVLQAGTYADGGEIFVLDMGEPVKIDTLARNLIKLAGFEPDVDIMISYTGLRPGEKMFEEKLMDEEGMRTTPNKLIHIGRPIAFDCDLFLTQLEELMRAAYDGRDAEIRSLVSTAVPTYKPID